MIPIEQLMEAFDIDPHTAIMIQMHIRQTGGEKALENIARLLGTDTAYAGEVDMRDGPPLVFVNMGDTYAITICLFEGDFHLCSWGDIVEEHPELFEEH